MTTILAVDDSMIVNAQIKRFAGEAMPNGKVITARSGEEALKIVETSGETFDLVIIDYHMEGMNGLETVEKLLELGVIEAKNCVICTANLQEIFANKLKEKGIRYLPKPLTFEKFQLLISSLQAA